MVVCHHARSSYQYVEDNWHVVPMSLCSVDITGHPTIRILDNIIIEFIRNNKPRAPCVLDMGKDVPMRNDD